jgi:putative lipoic acid-binding regulatory protein
MTRDLSREKLDLPYPCRWVYKIIGEDEEALRSAAAAVLQSRKHAVSLSRMSAHRNYCCLNVEVVVHDEPDRVSIYDALRRQAAVRLVL